MSTDAIRIQRQYYAATAGMYDEMHTNDIEHDLALAFMLAAAEHFEVQSILDIGSGTGRMLLAMKVKMPHLRVVGIEPSPELRQLGYEKGLATTELIDGDAMNLELPDESFDLVCEYAALHHIPRPGVAVGEMVRVARKLVFISDLNNFGHGRRISRVVKQCLNFFGAWPIADLIKTKGKGFTISEGDGLSYSYSAFNEYKMLSNACRSVHMMNTTNARPNLYATASHVALLGIKKY